MLSILFLIQLNPNASTSDNNNYHRANMVRNNGISIIYVIPKVTLYLTINDSCKYIITNIYGG